MHNNSVFSRRKRIKYLHTLGRYVGNHMGSIPEEIQNYLSFGYLRPEVYQFFGQRGLVCNGLHGKIICKNVSEALY